jgi:nucleoredoxin
MGKWIIAGIALLAGAGWLSRGHAPEATGTAPIAWDAKMLARLTADLADAEGKPAPARELLGAQRILLYFSANWCPPCRAFTPRLVDYYRSHDGGKAFKLLFVGSDQSAEAMQAYMREDAMPWWGVAFDSDSDRQLTKAYSGDGIPRLVLLDGKGRILADSFEGERYLGPQRVLDALDAEK